LAPDARAVARNRAARRDDVVAISARTGEGCDTLLDLLDRRLAEGRRIVDLEVDLADGAAIAFLYRHGEVVSRQDEDGMAHFQVGLAPAFLARYHAGQYRRS
jgi:GTP-binding protein HflX